MAVWTPDNPHSWATAHGLVSVPLFGAKREPHHRGRHHVLLDGERLGIAFSVGQSDDLPAIDEAFSWSWSSNLTHSLFLDTSARRLIVRRWDRPDEVVDERPLPTERQAAEILIGLAASDVPSKPTVVRKMIAVFRTVRGNIDRLGGTTLDAIHAFNAVLVWADAWRKQSVSAADAENIVTLREVLRAISTQRLAALNPSRVSASVGDFPVRDLIEELLRRDPSTGLILDPGLLIRHAAGELFQEAHIALAQRAAPERTLFPVVTLDASPPRGRPKSDAHFTPPSLARAMVQQALAAVSSVRDLPPTIEVLDPACGSGVFLVEALREIGYVEERSVRLRGFDTSDVSQAMTDFCLRQAVLEGTPNEVEIEVEKRDAIVPRTSWGHPDLILMNPPFSPWRSMTDEERQQVKGVLGKLYSGQADKALAFLAKAVRALKPGAALGTLLPAPMLEGRSGQKFRAMVERDRALSLTLVGRFRGLGYFQGVAVEPAFFVVVREISPATTDRPVRVVMAGRGDEDRAIRELRRGADDAADPRGGWEVTTSPRGLLTPASWTPRSRATNRTMDALARAGVPRVSDLFDTQLGIKTGSNKVFVLTDAQFAALDPSETERQLFRPVAEFSTIHGGRIEPGKYVFYPYGPGGKPLFATDADLRLAAPNYFNQYLQRNKAFLEDRLSLRARKWWELVEPRPTWQPQFGPKLVSAVFAQPGKFAYDAAGNHCVVQGFAWLWRKPEFHSTQLPYAYLALLNSQAFASLLAYSCPRVRAGQFDVYPKYVNRVFLPDLSITARTSPQTFATLVGIGHAIDSGNDYATASLEQAVAEAYSRPLAPEAVAERFRELVALWRKETAVLSSLTKKVGHQAHQEIVSLGETYPEVVLPLVLTELRNRTGYWFEALRLIAKESPLKAADVNDAARAREAWLSWGRAKGWAE